MKKACAKKETSQKVKIVDGKLILSLPDAVSPVVWQMDIVSAQSAAFQVQEDKKKKTVSLVLKNEEGGIDEIASFVDKDSAVSVLMETADVLQNAHGKLQSSSAMVSVTTPSSGKKSDALGAVLAFLMIVTLFVVWMFAASNSSMLNEIEGVNGGSAQSASSSETAGVPVSADDFLSNR